MRVVFCALVFGIGLAVCVAAQAASQKRPVQTAELSRLVDIPHEQFTLNNGLRVIVHTDRKSPVVAVSVWYGVGSKHEPKGKTGFAHLFEHLMFNGSENAPGDYFQPLQQVGATDFNGTTWLDRTNYFQTVPTAALERALFLESDRMGHLLGAVTQATLDNQRGVVQNEKRQGDNRPYGLVDYHIFENLFPQGHPYHHSTIGSMADLSAASLDDVKRWFKDNYGPNNAVIVLAGDIDKPKAFQLINKYFADIPRGPEVRKIDEPVPTLKAPILELIKDRVATTRILRSWATPGLEDRQSVALEAATHVLGGLSSSRLDNTLVRKEKVAVEVSAESEVFKHASVISVSMDVKPGVSALLAGKRLDDVIAQFIKNGPTEDELKRAVTKMISNLVRGLEAVGGFAGKATSLAEGMLYAGDPNFYRKRLATWSALTTAEVKAAAQQWLSRPAYALTVEPGERTESGAERGGWGDEVAPKTDANLDRSKLPAAGAPEKLDFPKVERGTLANGIPVIYARRTTHPVVNLVVDFDAGYAADPKTALGTQSFMLNLLKQGTTTKDSIAIAEEEERLGATISTSATLDRTFLKLNALSPNLEPSLGLLTDVITNPKFDPSEVERIRAQQLSLISRELNDPNAMAMRTLQPILFGAEHPYGVPPSGLGDAAVIAKVSKHEVAQFHAQWLRPENARIVATGDVPFTKLLSLLNASLGKWDKPKVARPTKTFAQVIPVAKPRVILVDRPKSPQSVILAGHTIGAKGSDDLLSLKMANWVFGGNFLSRINMNLREAKGWSYGVRSQFAEYMESSALLIRAPVQADRTGDSIKELLSDLNAFLTSKGVTADERERLINSNTRSLPGSFERSEAVLEALLEIVNFGRSDDYYEKLAPRYLATTAKEVDDAGRSKMNVKTLVFVVVGDAAVVKPQLEALNLPIEIVPAPRAS